MEMILQSEAVILAGRIAKAKVIEEVIKLFVKGYSFQSWEKDLESSVFHEPLADCIVFDA